MKIPKKIVIPVSLLLVLTVCALWLYFRFEPSRHFSSADIPVLAKPTYTSDLSGNRQSSKKQAIKNGVSPNNGLAAPSPRDTADGKLKEIQGAKGSFNMLLLAVDARAEEASRTDVLMLVHVNPANQTVRLVSIPRDTRVNLPGIGLTKINHAHALGEMKGKGVHSGTTAAIQAVSDLCGCTINYYVKTNFEGFEHFIDTIGGLDVELDVPVKLTYDHLTLPAGKQHWDGRTTLHFARERKSLPEGDSGRQENQALVLKAIVQKLLKPGNLAQIPALIDQVKEDILDTNLSKSDMISLAWMAKDVDAGEITYAQFPGSSGKAYDPLVKAELYYWMPDLTAWSSVSEQLLGD
ncbi:LCP family protein [Paenibacillus puldeungensis]|uniref:LCP family protein n=1 Tax=Paenibacillus puldeungensis TaxID=696536 RepID=A0ABW3RUI7_9BACL